MALGKEAEGVAVGAGACSGNAGEGSRGSCPGPPTPLPALWVLRGLTALVQGHQTPRGRLVSIQGYGASGLTKWMLRQQYYGVVDFFNFLLTFTVYNCFHQCSVFRCLLLDDFSFCFPKIRPGSWLLFGRGTVL